MFIKAIQDAKPTHVAIAFDVRAKTFRHKMFDGYKAQRKGMPDDLAAQLLDLKELLKIMKIAILEKEGFEADDVIGTVARHTSETGQCNTIILSADRDGFQLVNECTELHLTKTGVTNLDIWTPERVLAEYGIEPAQFIDLKALMGDKSDNIPGAMGVGEKTALALIKQHGNIETLFENNPPEKVSTQKDMVILSKQLATINCDVPIEYNADDFAFAFPMSQNVFKEFKKRHFHSLCNRQNLWNDGGSRSIHGIASPMARNDGGEKSHGIPTQQSFFDTPPSAAPPAPEPQKSPTTPAEILDSALEPILLKMHKNGAKIDLAALQRLSDEYSQEIETISAKIFELVGITFNINSPQQLGDVLYKKLGIETVQKTKTGYSTNESVLHKIEKMHAVVPEILKYRKVYKLYSTYIQGLRKLVDSDNFVHSTFQSNTVTGRLSSTEPNLQNIPARSDAAQKIRSLFISRFSGVVCGKILVADYSQIELRILAHLSGDPLMKEAFQNNRDIHAETAAALGIDRRTAKAVNFGITYGQTAFGLSETLGIPVGDATKIIENYYARFPKIKAYLDSCRDFAITHGYIETMFGRRRNLPELTSRNQHLVGFGTRAAMNMPMQGAAADIMKKAMLAIDSEITKLNLKSIMISQIHDELVFDVPADEVETMTELVKRIMQGIVTLDIPLVVDIEVGDTL